MSENDFVEAFSWNDFEPLAGLIGDAKIVAIGENNHHIREFGDLRHRLLRFLIERQGFSVLGFESGFAESALVDAWLHGVPGEVADIGREGFTFSLGESDEMHGMLHWLRAHNENGPDVRYAGLDVPGSAGSPLPALHAVRRCLDGVDSAAVSLADRAIAATEPYAAVSSAVAPGLYAALDTAARDAATAALAVLVGHLESVAPVYPGVGGPALHNAIGALRVDTYLREVVDMMAGAAPALHASSRDQYMASTVRRLREWHGEDTRIVLMLHNGHLQRVPCQVTPALAIPSAGTHLAGEFGDDYFALGLTACAGSTTGLAPEEGTRLGFRLYEQELGEPVEGSVEHTLLGRGPAVVDLRSARAEGIAGPDSIRHAHLQSQVDVVQAFDALVYLPEMHVSRHVTQPQASPL